MKPNIGKGDNGTTCFRGTKINKSSKLIKFIGEVDELNSFLGFCRSFIKNKDVDKSIEEIQNKLFIIGAIVSGTKIKFEKENIDFLNREIKKYEKELKPLKHFIYPAGVQSSSALQVARAICRRVERSCIESRIKELVPFFNRLSDLLFILARVENKRARIREKEWKLEKL
ncbi:MAG: cob(I)yrinic acid a,c-diamide adenosyltransferase [Candidatus Aenigmatarchaeota archaeon]